MVTKQQRLDKNKKYILNASKLILTITFGIWNLNTLRYTQQQIGILGQG